MCYTSIQITTIQYCNLIWSSPPNLDAKLDVTLGLLQYGHGKVLFLMQIQICFKWDKDKLETYTDFVIVKNWTNFELQISFWLFLTLSNVNRKNWKNKEVQNNK